MSGLFTGTFYQTRFMVFSAEFYRQISVIFGFLESAKSSRVYVRCIYAVA